MAARRVPFDPDCLERRDPALITRLLPTAERFARHYFRFRAEGATRVPEGRVMFVANHNGGIMGPDLFCTLPFLWRALTVSSPLYALAHDFAMVQVTALGRLLQKFGAVRASRHNAQRVLARGGQVLVYPGGDLDAYRHFDRRNEVVILPRTGFVDVARAAAAPIVPIVTYGAHRSAYIFSEGEAIARALRLERWARLQRFPLALALPWGLAAGPWLPYLPLPFSIRLRVLEPMSAEPAESTPQFAERVQRAMQTAMSDLSGDAG